MPIRTMGLVVMGAGLVSACGDQPLEAPTASRTDSAGVEIVVNAIAPENAQPFARLDSVPEFAVGSLNGPEAEQFGSIGGVLPLSSGEVAVLDGQASEIRVFDRAGTFLRTIGQKGDGPGEFQQPNALALFGDTVAVYDVRHRRITRLGLDGSLLGTIPLDAAGFFFVALFTRDGGLVAQSFDLSGGMGSASHELQLTRDRAVLFRVTPEGNAADTLDRLPGRESLRSIVASDGRVNVLMRSLPFGRRNVVGVGEEYLWSGASDQFVFHMRSLDTGALVRIIRAPGLDRALTDAIRAEALEHAVADSDGTPEDLETIQEGFDLSPDQDLLPAYDRFVVDDNQRVWVRQASVTGPPTTWWVFDQSGEALGYVEVPERSTIQAIRCDEVWVETQDDFDVPSVAMYRAAGLDPC